jgi:hypothetical protein
MVFMCAAVRKLGERGVGFPSLRAQFVEVVLVTFFVFDLDSFVLPHASPPFVFFSKPATYGSTDKVVLIGSNGE